MSVTRYECPFAHCQWTHDDYGPTSGELLDLTNKALSRNRHITMSEAVSEVARMRHDRVEVVLEDHMLTIHRLAKEDAIATIKALREDDFEIPVAPI
jgi:hypothetical protein